MSIRSRGGWTVGLTLVVSNAASVAGSFLLGQSQLLPGAILLAAGLVACAVVASLGMRGDSSVRMLERLDAAERGDLDQLLEIGVLNRSMVTQRVGTLLRRLRATVIDVQLSGQDLAGAGEAILSAIDLQTSGAAGQSAAIAQTSATVEEVKSSARQASELAATVAETARAAHRLAAEGVQAVDAATGGMVDIRTKVDTIAENILALAEQAQHIGEIIGAVSDIADQCHILALNAAMEATRAGEHGRGFAVVAAEIRGLSQQSKSATAEVRHILSDVQRLINAAVMATEQGTRGVESGVDLIDQSGRTITGLADVIAQTADSAQQISAAVRQHTIGMEQIDAAMRDIGKATNLNLQAGEATEQTARALIALSARLNQSVEGYYATPSDEDLKRLTESAPLAEVALATYPSAGFDFSAAA
jgi:methyl-accepting chemotaxis protein